MTVSTVESPTGHWPRVLFWEFFLAAEMFLMRDSKAESSLDMFAFYVTVLTLVNTVLYRRSMYWTTFREKMQKILTGTFTSGWLYNNVEKLNLIIDLTVNFCLSCVRLVIIHGCQAVKVSPHSFLSGQSSVDSLVSHFVNRQVR